MFRDWILLLILLWKRRCQIELDNLPVIWSVKRPEALHLGSSGKTLRNLSRRFLNLSTEQFETDLSHGGRQFHRLHAVRAKEQLRWITAGLWWRTGLYNSHLLLSRILVLNLRTQGPEGSEGFSGKLGTKPSFILNIYIILKRSCLRWILWRLRALSLSV